MQEGEGSVILPLLHFCRGGVTSVCVFLWVIAIFAFWRVDILLCFIWAIMWFIIRDSVSNFALPPILGEIILCLAFNLSLKKAMFCDRLNALGSHFVNGKPSLWQLRCRKSHNTLLISEVVHEPQNSGESLSQEVYTASLQPGIITLSQGL